MTHAEIAAAYLETAQAPSLQGLLGYIDAYDKTVLTLEEVNALIAAVGGNRLLLATRESYAAACASNRQALIQRLGITEEELRSQLEKLRNQSARL